MNDEKTIREHIYTRIQMFLYLKIFRPEGITDEWYVRLWNDASDGDETVTFGPYSEKDARTLHALLRKTTCDIAIESEGPFERTKEEAAGRTIEEDYEDEESTD